MLWKRGKIAPMEQFFLFPTIFSLYLLLKESYYIFICLMWLFDSVKTDQPVDQRSMGMVPFYPYLDNLEAVQIHSDQTLC